jgi:surfactin synthase thioesterase subunit
MVTVQEAQTWREHTSGDFALKVFPGGHFYLGDHIAQVAAVVTEGMLAGTATS